MAEQPTYEDEDWKARVEQVEGDLNQEYTEYSFSNGKQFKRDRGSQLYTLKRQRNNADTFRG